MGGGVLGLPSPDLGLTLALPWPTFAPPPTLRNLVFFVLGPVCPPKAPSLTSAVAFWGLCLPLCTCWCPRVDFGQIFGPRAPKMTTSWSPLGAPEPRISNEFAGFAEFRRFTPKVSTMTPRSVQRIPKSHPKPPKSLPKGAQREPKVAPRAPSGVHLALWEDPLAHFGLQMGALGPSSAPFGGVLGPSRFNLPAPGDISDQHGPKSVHVDTI